jgi:lipopolysaccharide export system protein LptA
MRDRVARLRLWLAGSAILLMAVIVAYIGYGRFVSHLRHLRLPLPPGVNIVREAGGWTYSRANGSKTLYTIHAAGFEQGKNGKTALHHVSVVLFGKNGDRNDHVSGQDFEYDEKNGVLRALGLVHIDLQSAAAAKAVGQGGQASTVEGPDGEESLAPDVMHVTTSGLVYLEKLGIAATSEDVDVQSGDMKGHARGADYSSDSGMLMLHSAVSMAGTSGGHAVRITAGQAQFDQRAQEARLTSAKYESEGRSVAAEHAVLHRRADGKLGKVDADGNVTLADEGGKAVAARAELQMNAAGQPASALLSGGVTYAADEPLRQIRGTANEARVSFASTGGEEADHAVFTGAVHAVERIRPAQITDGWNSRELTAAKLETWMAAGAAGRMQLRNAEATGGARLISVDEVRAKKADGPVRTEVAADQLKAVMSLNGPGVSLDRLIGSGHTSLLQVSGNGVEQTSRGDTLDARFRPVNGTLAAKSRGAGTSPIAQTLSSAVQQGHVTMERRVPARPDAAKKLLPEELQRAVADRAAYDGTKDQLLLSGTVRMSDAGSAMWAEQVLMDRTTGDAHASGPVKVDYVADASTAKQAGEPLRVMAERADVDGANSSATFYGSPVRVWQSGNQVQAPEVQVERVTKRLIARGSGKTGWSGVANGAPVRTILVSAAENGNDVQQTGAAQARCGVDKAAPGDAGNAKGTTSSVVRIASGGLVYSGVLQQVEFTGGVRADTPDATVRAAQATAYLAEDRGAKKSSLPSFEGGLNRIAARGQVDLTRPGTHVSGDRLVYEAADRTFLLSGGDGEPAKTMDARGTTTAAAFRFNACDDTLEALGESPGAPTQRVKTDAVASSAGKRDKAGR